MPEIILRRLMSALDTLVKRVGAWITVILLIIPMGIPILLTAIFVKMLKEKLNAKRDTEIND